MKIAILSDIHANYPALQAVIEDAEFHQVEHFWILGDGIGYGPHPVEVLLWLKDHQDQFDFVMGNHEDMLLKSNWCYEAVGKSAQDALYLNRKEIEEDGDSISFWNDSLQKSAYHLQKRIDGIDFLLAHSAFTGHPFLRYLYSWDEVVLLPEEFGYLQKKANSCPLVKLSGHTHVPSLITASKQPHDNHLVIKPSQTSPFETYSIDCELTMINPGSVGQPRDLDQRAAYALLDTLTQSVTFLRVSYDRLKTAEDLAWKGYPESLITRLRTADITSEVPPFWRNHFETIKGLKP